MSIQTTIKRIAAGALVFAAVFFVYYLSASFAAASFIFFVGFFTLSSYFIGLVSLEMIEQYKDNRNADISK